MRRYLASLALCVALALPVSVRAATITDSTTFVGFSVSYDSAIEGRSRES